MAADISRVVRWVNDIAARRMCGEEVLPEELIELQRAKVEVLAAIVARNEAEEGQSPSSSAVRALDEARARLAELEAGAE